MNKALTRLYKLDINTKISILNLFAGDSLMPSVTWNINESELGSLFL
jgi:hypothetical protein